MLCLERDMTKRPSVAQLLEHEWFKVNLKKVDAQEETVLNIIENISLFRKASVL